MVAKRILITAGGTGGHLFPAQALAQEINRKMPLSQILFMAGGLATNRYFDREKFSFHEVACSPLFSLNPLRFLKGFLSLCKGIKQSIKHLKQFRPDIVIGFGSYYTVATLLAARYMKIPYILHEANSIPGKANLWLAPFAKSIALHFPSTSKYFKGNTIHVGLPLREGYHSSSLSKENALAYYGFAPGKKTLLICGGSQGAASINFLIKNALAYMSNLQIQIIHLTGNEEVKDQLSLHYNKEGIVACVKVFEDQMQFAWKAADFFVARAKALMPIPPIPMK